MTFEEIQKTIEGMLAVQRQLQESQFELREAQQRERETLQIISLLSKWENPYDF